MMAKTLNEKRRELLQTLLIVAAVVGGLTANVYVGYGYSVTILQSLVVFIFLAVILYSSLLSETTRQGRLYTLEAVAVAFTFSFMFSEVVAQIIGSAGQALLTLVAGTAILTLVLIHDGDESPVIPDVASEGITS